MSVLHVQDVSSSFSFSFLAGIGVRIIGRGDSVIIRIESRSQMTIGRLSSQYPRSRVWFGRGSGMESVNRIIGPPLMLNPTTSPLYSSSGSSSGLTWIVFLYLLSDRCLNGACSRSVQISGHVRLTHGRAAACLLQINLLLHLFLNALSCAVVEEV